MPPKTKTTVLITGCNRGIGLGLLKHYLLQPSHTIIAAIRNPSHPTSQSLPLLPMGKDTSLITIKLDASIESDAHNAVAELRQKHDVESLDVVIANAGIASVFPTVRDVRIGDVEAHMRVNVYGVIALYQAVRGLLRESMKVTVEREPVFMVMGSSAGLLTNHLPIPNAAYAPTKTALNWYTRRIDGEEPWLNCFSIDPGHVATELGDAAAVAVGIGEHAPTSVEESCEGIMGIMEGASKERYGGRLVRYTGEFCEW